MRPKMSLLSRRELLARTSARYRAARWCDKGHILDEFVVATGYSRKHALTLLNHCEPARPKTPRHRQRFYDDAVQEALITVWKAANCICSKRLVPFLPEFVATLEQFGHLALAPCVKERLLSMSVATVDRLLFQERHPQGRGLSTTKHGSLLKHQIPVRPLRLAVC